MSLPMTSWARALAFATVGASLAFFAFCPRLATWQNHSHDDARNFVTQASRADHAPFGMRDGLAPAVARVPGAWV